MNINTEIIEKIIRIFSVIMFPICIIVTIFSEHSSLVISNADVYEVGTISFGLLAIIMLKDNANKKRMKKLEEKINNETI